MTQMTTYSFDPAVIAKRLLRAHKDASLVPLTEVLVPNSAAAYAVQDAIVRALGGLGAWKVGAKGPAMQPACAPLPAAGLFDSGATLRGARWRVRGIELEVALRLGRDLNLQEPDPAMLRNAI